MCKFLMDRTWPSRREIMFCYHHGVVMHPANMTTWRYEETSAKTGCGYKTGCLRLRKLRETSWNRDAPMGIRESKESEV